MLDEIINYVKSLQQQVEVCIQMIFQSWIVANDDSCAKAPLRKLFYIYMIVRPRLLS